jgi:hypothetical protein
MITLEREWRSEIKEQRWLMLHQVFGYEIETVERSFNITVDSYETINQFAETAEFRKSVVVEALLRVGMKEAIAYYKQQEFKPSKNKRLNKLRWGNYQKTNVMYTISTEADDLLERYAYEMREYKSELLECAIRSGALEKAKALLMRLITV